MKYIPVAIATISFIICVYCFIKIKKITDKK